MQWRDDQPIYLQLQEWVKGMILDGSLAGGEALPSVRKVAARFQVNPLTVMKAYQQLADEGLVEKRRGRGIYCLEDARTRLMAQERRKFLHEEWPRILHRMQRLGIDVEELLDESKKGGGG